MNGKATKDPLDLFRHLGQHDIAPASQKRIQARCHLILSKRRERTKTIGFNVLRNWFEAMEPVLAVGLAIVVLTQILIELQLVFLSH